MSMQIAVIQFPGANCERETMLALKRAGMFPEEFLWNQPSEKLQEYAGFVIVGGFSYEDRGRAGVIAALDPLMDGLKIQNQLGKPILGICNGAQILVEAGLVPGLEKYALGMALTDNKRIKDNAVLGTGYYNAWVYMRLAEAYQRNAFTKYLTPKDILWIPVAHGEGRFIIPDALLMEMQHNGQCVFQYCDADGHIIADFPINPNGSVWNIAAVSNKAGNVMAIMPHPERTDKCDAIFHSMRDYIAKGYSDRVAPLHYIPRQKKILSYTPKPHAYELLLELNITDNHAVSMNHVLTHLGIEGKLKRYIHWEVNCDSLVTFERIKASGMLYNPRKENVIERLPSQNALLVRAKDDMLGQIKRQHLQRHYQIEGISSIHHGILWVYDDLPDIIHSTILYNPYAHDYYDYERRSD